MQIDLLNEFQISASLSKEINSLLVNCFPYADFDGRDYFKQMPHCRLLAQKDKQLIGQLAIDFRVMNLNNNPVNVFGIIDMCVHPDYQGLGIARKLIERFESIATANADKIDFLFLVTEISDFYRKFGFKTTTLTTQWLKIDKHKNYGLGDEQISDAFFMVKPISNKKWEDGKLDMLGYMY